MHAKQDFFTTQDTEIAEPENDTNPTYNLCV